MRVGVVTLFPELFGSFVKTSLVGRAIDAGVLTLHVEHLRDHGVGAHRSVDDTPYGGGSGMVLRVDCVVDAVRAAETQRSRRILLSPQGRRFRQGDAEHLARCDDIVLICGRYEGFDERVRRFVDDEISLGDYVLAGGEVPAMALLEAIVRLVPGVLGNHESTSEESFSTDWGGILEYPQYTRPPSYEGHVVPGVLCSGDHRKIAEWRRERALERTRTRRPDLLAPHGGSGDDD